MACSELRAQSWVGLPFRASRMASAVPQEPAPRTAIGVDLMSAVIAINPSEFARLIAQLQPAQRALLLVPGTVARS